VRNIWTIWRKELKIYFVSPIAYHLLAFTAVVFGFFFAVATAIFVSRGMQSMRMGTMMPMDVNEWVIRPLLMNISVIGLFVTPMISMRLFAEEKFAGTIELLMTSPVRDLELVLGKMLAAFLLYAAIVGICFLNFSLLFIYGNADGKPMLGGLLGLVLMGTAFLSLGMFLSTFTRNQIIAGTLTFGLLLMLWILDWAADSASGYSSRTAEVIRYLSLTTHLENSARGVLDLRDLVYYLSVIFLGIFLTHRSLESLRWRS